MEDVRVAYQTMTASNANLARIRDELIPLQQQRRTLAEDAYREGQSDVTDLFLDEQDLRLTQAKAIEVERLAVTAFVRLQRAVGGPGVASPLMAAPTAAIPTQSDAAAGRTSASPLSALPTVSNR